MPSHNAVQLIGNLGRDPELRYTPGGDRAITALSLATSRSWKAGDGTAKEETDWHRIVAFGRLAEIVAEYGKKGRLLFVEGRLHTRKYDKDGSTHFVTEVIAESLQFLDSSPKGTNDPMQGARAPHGVNLDDLPELDDPSDIPF